MITQTPMVLFTAAQQNDVFARSRKVRTPKNLVKIDGEHVLDRSLSSYSLPGSELRVAITAEEENEFSTSKILRNKDQVEFKYVGKGLKGALVTALVALDNADPKRELLIVPGDSRVLGGLVEFHKTCASENYEAAAMGFISSSPRWSYVLIDERNRVLQVAEKQVISEKATTGVFYFRTVQSFINAAEWCLVNNASTNGIFYTSMALNYLVSTGKQVGFYEIPATNYEPFDLTLNDSNENL